MDCFFKQTLRQKEKVETHKIKDEIRDILGNNCYFCGKPLTKKGIVIHHLQYNGKRYSDFNNQLDYHKYLESRVKSHKKHLVMAHTKCHRNNLNARI